MYHDFRGDIASQIGTHGGVGGGDGGGGSGGGGGDGLAVRVAGVALVGSEPIAGEFFEKINKRSGQSKCALNAQYCAPAIISLSVYVERGWKGGGERARVAAHNPPRLAPLRARVHRREPLPPSDHKGLLVQLEPGNAGGA